MAARRRGRQPARARRQLSRRSQPELRRCSVLGAVVAGRRPGAAGSCAGRAPTGARSCGSRGARTAPPPRRCAASELLVARDGGARRSRRTSGGPRTSRDARSMTRGTRGRDGQPAARAALVRGARGRARRRERGAARAAGQRRRARGRHRAPRDRGRPAIPRRGVMEIDVFTLFPEAFGWFEAQRHVANATRGGHRLGYVNYRDHTPLSAGQVDDTPFGGGAGMVLRVDVVEAALRARYGVDPVELRAQRRVIALTPGGRLLDDAAGRRARRRAGADAAVRPLRGLRRARARALRQRRVSIGRYVLAGGELAGDGASATRCSASCPARSATRSRRWRSRSARRSRARPSTRTTRARPSTAAGACPRCCCPATTRGSASGGREQSRARARRDGTVPLP